MTGPHQRPLLFLDVDGPLIPFGATPQQLPQGYPTYRPASGGPSSGAGNPLVARIDPAFGPKLAALGCELVWATTWLDSANECVAPWLGLPALAVVEWPEDPEDLVRGLHWKTAPIVDRAAGRPFVWVDDEISATDRAWVAGRHPGRALLQRIDPRIGLTDADFAAIRAWLRTGEGGAVPM
ncbi:hypothetical protein OHT61_17695 [Streptomyces sp. NBC_00178]|uniref:HAD domain-containing protein n=1 Tax=Streptomyces sp. NBC_00178 TaxID=2975672 RepID=UPI002E2C2B69|nr:HAD domain-containing protein [Streptomyces sp. NBC_00178]